LKCWYAAKRLCGAATQKTTIYDFEETWYWDKINEEYKTEKPVLGNAAYSKFEYTFPCCYNIYALHPQLQDHM
jgi:hypothetical protein